MEHAIVGLIIAAVIGFIFYTRSKKKKNAGTGTGGSGSGGKKPGIEQEKSVSSLIDLLAASGLAKSKTEARSFIQSGSVAINGAKVEALDHAMADAERLFGRFTLLRRGKKLYSMIRWA